MREGFRAGLKLAIVVCIPFFAAFFLFGRQMTLLFMDEGSVSALNTGVEFLKIVSPFYFIISIKLIADGVLRGAGTMAQFMISTFSDLILRVGLSFLLAIPLGTTGIWLSWPIGWVLGTGLSYGFYRSGCWNPLKTKEK